MCKLGELAPTIFLVPAVVSNGNPARNPIATCAKNFLENGWANMSRDCHLSCLSLVTCCGTKVCAGEVE